MLPIYYHYIFPNVTGRGEISALQLQTNYIRIMKKIDSKRKEEFLSEMLDFGFENNLEFLGDEECICVTVEHKHVDLDNRLINLSADEYTIKETWFGYLIYIAA